MQRFFSKLGISGVALSIFIAILASISLYFYITLETNQQTLEKRGYRTLEKLGSSIKQKERVYGYVVKNLHNFMQVPSGDSLPVIPQEFGQVAQSLKPYRKKNTVDNEVVIYKTTYHPKPKEGSGHQTDSATLQISLTDFVTPLLFWDFFSGYLLIRDSKISFSTLPGDIKLTNPELPEVKGKKVSMDPLLTPLADVSETYADQSVIESGNVRRITIRGVPYLLFAVPLNFRHESNCILGGLIEERVFNKAKKSLPSDHIIFFIVILGLIIFSIPVLKAFIMGPREKLTRPAVSLIGISIGTGALLFTVMLSQVMIKFQIKFHQQEQLVRLNDTLRVSFDREKEIILSQLNTYKTMKQVFPDSMKPVPSIFSSNELKLKWLTRPSYPYYKNLFWANGSGNQGALFTPFKYSPTARINNRAYFIRPDKYKFRDGWYSMEPVFMRTTGDWSIAFSVPSGYAGIKIIALTASMISLKSPVLQKGYEYFLIDKTGTVWYHSREILDLNDNLLTECQNSESLKALLNSNDSSLLPLIIRSQKYNTYVAPVNNTDLFIVSVVNPERENVLASFTVVFVMLFFAGAFLILLTFYGLFLLLRKKKSKLAGKEYFFSRMLPNHAKSKAYMHLIIVNGLIFTGLSALKLFGSFKPLPLSFLIVFMLILMGAHCLFTWHKLRTCKNTRHIKDKIGKINNATLYTLFILSWLLISTVMPVTLLTGTIFSEVTRSYIKKQQVYLAHEINERTEALHNYYRDNITSAYGDSLFRERNKAGLYFRGVDNTTLKPWHDANPGSRAKHKAGVLEFTGSAFDRIMNETDQITTDPLTGCRVPDTTFAGSALIFDKLEYTADNEKTTTESIFVTNNPFYDIFAMYHDGRWKILPILFWLITGLMFLVTGYLVKHLLKLLFFPPDSAGEHQVIVQDLKELAKSPVSAIVISNHESYLDILPQSSWRCIDLEKDISSEDQSSMGQLALINFELRMESIEVFRKNYNTLAQIAEESTVMLWLTKRPELLIDTCMDTWSRQKNAEEAVLLAYEFTRFVAGMPVIYPSASPSKGKDHVYCETLTNILAAEKKFNPAIQAYAMLLERSQPHASCSSEHPGKKRHKNAQSCMCGEDLILKIQELSFSYYDFTWKSLSEDEQFLLLDLAEDSLLNLKNKQTITLLLRRGILQRNERIEFVSLSFKNFILTEVDKSTFEKKQKQLLAEGNWHKFRVPLLLAASSIAILLFLTQQDFLSNMNTILVALGAMTGVYMRLSGLFSSKPGAGSS